MKYMTVGSYEAKTKLPELLREVKMGKRYTITSRGEPIAELVPVRSEQADDIALAVQQMQAIMANRPSLKKLTIKELKDEGRA